MSSKADHVSWAQAVSYPQMVQYSVLQNTGGKFRCIIMKTN